MAVEEDRGEALAERIREQLVRLFGWPDRLPDDVSGRVLVFGHGSKLAAESYAAADWSIFGHPSRAELREGVGWCTVVDLRPAIARADAERRRAGHE
jgi:hypothetical protein